MEIFSNSNNNFQKWDKNISEMKLIHKDGKLTKKVLSWQYQKEIPIVTAEVATRKLGTAWHLFILILGGVKS